jgi:hypothetical protein
MESDFPQLPFAATFAGRTRAATGTAQLQPAGGARAVSIQTEGASTGFTFDFQTGLAAFPHAGQGIATLQLEI